MIHIKSTDAFHQYDEEGNAITTWDGKKCTWIVNPEYEDKEIDWWGEDNDFPAGETLKSFLAHTPNWDKKPNIVVSWTWNTKADMQVGLGRPTSYDEIEWYDKTTFPFTDSRDWGYLEYTEKEAIEGLGKYCGFHKSAAITVVRYNNKVIFNGKLE